MWNTDPICKRTRDLERFATRKVNDKAEVHVTFLQTHVYTGLTILTYIVNFKRQFMTSATTPFFIINPQNKKNISNDAFLYSIQSIFVFKLYFTFFHAFNLEHSIITVFCW